MAAIRGVNVDGVIRTLQQRGYIAELARDPGPGQAVLFGTTSHFLERLGLDTLDELPPLGDFVPSADVVEALETGLRVEDETEPVAPAAGQPGPADDDGFGDEEVIDLRSGSEGSPAPAMADSAVTPAEVSDMVEPLDAIVLLADEAPPPSTGTTDTDNGE